MRLRFELTPQDYAAFARHHNSGPKAPSRRTLTVSRFLFPAVWLAMEIPVLLRHPPSVVGWLLVTFAVLWAAFVPRWFRWSTARRVERLAREGISRGAVGPHELTVDETGISLANPFERRETVWAGVERLAEAPDHLLIYTGPHAAYIIPRRALPEGDAELRWRVERQLAEFEA